MTWYHGQLAKAVVDRLNADTGTGGLRNTGSPLVSVIRTAYVSPQASQPYITVDIVGLNATNYEAFATRTVELNVIVNVYVPAKPLTTDSLDPISRLDAITERVVGAAVLSGPSYGLDRWTPSLSGWTGGILVWADDANGPDNDDTVLHKAITFTATVSQGRS